MNTYPKLLTISVSLLFILIRTSVQDCYDKIYETKENGTCKIYVRYGRACLEYYKINIYQLNCYMITDSLPSDHPKDIRKIDIYTSNIDVNPNLFNNFVNVEVLSIQKSNITNIATDAFSNLTNLAQLNLTQNNIDILYKRPFNTKGKLNMLVLSKNNISVVEDDLLVGLSNLKTLYLDNNQIVTASPLMSNCGDLNTLDLSYNLIEQVEFSSECSQLRKLKLNNNNIQEFNVVLEEASALEYLDLGWNNVNYIDTESLKHLVVVNTLLLNNNPLFHNKELPVNLFHNKLELKYLNLSSTGIQNIVVGSFTGLINLLELDLSGNSLTSLPNGIFHDLSQLTELYLSNNYFTIFQYDGLPRGLIIDIDNNLWECDTLPDIMKSLKSQYVRIRRGSVHNTSNIFGINCLENENVVSQASKPTDSYESFFNGIRQDLHQVFSQQKEILNTSNSFFENLKNDMKEIILNITNTPITARSTQDNEELRNSDRPYRAMVAGIYCIFFIMVAGLFIGLFIILKKNKSVNNGVQEEFRTLNNFEE